MANQEYHIAGLHFLNAEVGEQAQKEFKAIQVINAKIDKGNIKAILELYNSAITSKMFKTAIGYEYLSELRDYMIASGQVSEDMIPDIPIYSTLPGISAGAAPAAAVDTKQEAVNIKQLKRLQEEKKKYKRNFKYTLIAAIVLLVMVIAMFIIAGTSDSPTILNYETVILNKYSEWEKELSEKEEALNQREEIINQTSNQRLNEVLSQNDTSSNDDVYDDDSNYDVLIEE